MTEQSQNHCTSRRRIVVTGMGVISPMGNTVETLWDNVLQGKSGIGPLTAIVADEATCKIAGQCNDFVPENYMDKKEARRMDRFTQLAVAAARGAYEQAGINGDVSAERVGVVVGSGVGGIQTIDQQMRHCIEKGFDRCSPFLVPMIINDMASGRISIEFKAKGPNISVVTACATGADSIGEGMRMIWSGEAEVVIAGGTEAPLTPLAMAGFASARALSQNGNPTQASRPFDKNRDGFVMSEGAGVMILEELEHALARGATIYGEVVGYGRSSDANDIVSPCADGDGAARAMIHALKNAGIEAQAIGYINAHGTSTPLGDIAETLAIKRVFGEYAKQGLSISSTKSMHGHMLGATGAVEAILTMLSVQNDIVPPTINLQDPDPECDLDYTPNVARKKEGLQYAMSNSFGFGGHNASLIFKKYSRA